MAVAQPGVFAPTEAHHLALEYTLLTDADADHVQRHIAKLIILLRDQTDIHHVLAFGPALCAMTGVMPASRPFNAFEPIHGLDGTSAPATQHDLLVWIQGPARDHVFDTALAVDASLRAVMACVLEVSGFVRDESRDLTGFIDGTANPTGDLMVETALIPDGQSGEGGAFVLTQKWKHNLDAFNELSVPDQEQVIGRTKDDSIELEGDDMPDNSHVSRTDVAVDGETQRIYRRSFPYGSVAEHGLYFLAFAHDQGRFDLQLRRMYGVTDDGIRDRITDFSAALTGSYFFAPSSDCLDGILA